MSWTTKSVCVNSASVTANASLNLDITSFICQLRSLLYYFGEIAKLFVVGLCFRFTPQFFYQCSIRSGRLLRSCYCRHCFRLRLWGPTISGHAAWLPKSKALARLFLHHFCCAFLFLVLLIPMISHHFLVILLLHHWGSSEHFASTTLVSTAVQAHFCLSSCILQFWRFSLSAVPFLSPFRRLPRLC
ncbi:unnamed protein product [Haemonchus placei]|uniref:G_PROTEIN_RECEP_F1_2 domain-containing protein n=1 Tax=Haemonchus placei TaxID=6290 RepID=A0A0N4W9H0_HAEPC|nr:unnamed protein product [Haemonchus placei]